MPTFNNGENAGLVRGKINDAITKVDGVEAGAEVNTINSDPAGIAGAAQIPNIVTLSQAAYDAIPTPDAGTCYLVTA